MKYNVDCMVKDALELGAAHAAIADVNNITFSEELRSMCTQNLCGKYGTNWMCPPGIGPLTELTERVKKYNQGLLFQSVYHLEDFFSLRQHSFKNF